jgi:MerR family transcriptional regulator, copper efflux regulator
MPSGLKIGELASSVGVSTDTVRYYERLNLLPHAGRTHSGYRVYSEEDIERLRFIKQAQTLGLSLEEIKGLLPERGSGLAECQRVRDLLDVKLEELDNKIAEARDFRAMLAAYKKECEEALTGERGGYCPALSEITNPGRSTPNQGSKKELDNEE